MSPRPCAAVQSPAWHPFSFRRPCGRAYAIAQSKRLSPPVREGRAFRHPPGDPWLHHVARHPPPRTVSVVLGHPDTALPFFLCNPELVYVTHPEAFPARWFQIWQQMIDRADLAAISGFECGNGELTDSLAVRFL